eukprot:gb/GFBE01054401.1/.p1 GENE.gb/GFBE01054401.1/~~gb/GFBE01054401.1/.p1  ORF type:complete len:491 (+),score=98.17 gb/GFBE01054401.1/:1-1473(+)
MALESPRSAQDDVGDLVPAVPRKLSKSGGSMKWLAKCLFPNLRGKGRCSAVVAPEPEPGSLAEVMANKVAAGGNTVAWEIPHSPAEPAELAEPAEPVDDLRRAAAMADVVASPVRPAPQPVPSSAELARSQALAAALAAEDARPSEQRFADFAEVYRREGKDPLPMELLDEPVRGALADLNVDDVLPPLPVLNTEKLTSAEVPGFAAEDAAAEEVSAEMTDQVRDRFEEVERQPRPRPGSFRNAARRGVRTGAAVADGASTSPQKAASSPQKAGRSAGVFSLSSRPTTAGEETGFTFPTSRETTMSTSWPEQWPLGAQEAPTQSAPSKDVKKKPVRVTASLKVPTQLTGNRPPLLPLSGLDPSKPSARAVAPPPPPLLDGGVPTVVQPPEQDPFFAKALKRATESGTVHSAMAPSLDRRKVMLSKIQAAGEADLLREKRAAAAVLELREASMSRAISKELEQTLCEVGLGEGKKDFSDLAVSFASLAEDM